MAVETHPSKRRPLMIGVVAASFAVALVCAVWSISSVSILPPSVKSRNLETAGATTAVMVDLPHSMIANQRPTWNFDVHSLITRAALLARLMATAPALEYIGRDAGVPPDQIAAVAPVTVVEPSELIDAGSEQRAREILLSSDRYRLEVQSRIDVPVIDIYALAPSPAAAQRLADAAIAGLRDYLRVLAVSERVGPASQVQLNQLGPARSGVINHGAALKIAGLTFLFVFALSCVVLLAVVRRLSGRAPAPPRDTDPLPRRYAAPSPRAGLTLSAVSPTRLVGYSGLVVAPSPAGAVAVTPWRLQLPARSIFSHGGDWPRTTRVMPWMLAAFMAILWLVPFDSIALKASLPVDMKFDRIVLPFLVITWLLSLATGGRSAPRVRVTRIHIAVGVFITLAFLSVLVNATSLNQTLELDTSIKQLPLLLAYLSFFLMMASVVRRTEVRAFLTFTLVLAVLCAIGMIVEYKTQYNVFFELSRALLPGIFTVAINNSGYDDTGRLLTHGPTAHGLAAASILSMALAIAITRIMHAERGRGRALYTFVAGVLMVAVLATQKKTGLVAPAAAVLTFACFRGRELLKMAPLALILLIVVLIVSPGTIDPVIKQFSPSQLGAAAPATTSDRAARYDAIRPDVWTHLAVGRGYGSYQPLGHRVLDSEILLRLIETGVLGLVAYLLLGVSVVATARAAIRSRHPARAPPALAGAAAAIVFLVVGALFDSFSFPQVPYIFLYLAALVAVVAKPPEEASPSWR